MPSKKILIVDDEPTIVDMLSSRLKASGYEVCTARDGLDALRKVKTEKPDLLVIDVLMPSMSGFEATVRIREIPEFSRIPVLAISARSSMKDFFSNVAGAEFISKPFEPKDLVNRVELLLGGKADSGGGPRRVILVGVEDFLVEKIKTLLSSLKCEVLTALNEEDALTMARNLRPAFILCQYWEENSVLDAKKLSGKLMEHTALVHVPLYVYCKEALSIEAMKTFKGDRLITYMESSDLLKKLESLIATNATK